MTPLPCPYCGNSHPRWLTDGMLPESGCVICGNFSCGGEMQAASEQQGWSRWNTRTSQRINDELLHALKKMRRTMYSDKSEESVVADAAIARAESLRTSDRVPDGARMARCSLCKQHFPADYLSAGVCATCRPQAGWVQS